MKPNGLRYSCLVISDDLTGANDTGLQFARKGFSVIVQTDASQGMTLESLSEDSIGVVNAETRSLSPKQAYQAIETLCKQIDFSAFDHVYKKIDSTLRGNIGSELDALLDTRSFNAALVIPAYPPKGRITVGGYHLLHQTLLEDSEISRDPKHPVKHSFLADILSEQSERTIAHLDVKCIRNGRIAEGLKQYLEEGVEIVTMDSCTPDDLDSIVQQAATLPFRLLWVGSAGLADALTGHLKPPKIAAEHSSAADRHISAEQGTASDAPPVLVAAGSLSEVTRKQVEALKAHSFRIVTLDPAMLVRDKEAEVYLESALLDWTQLLASGQDLVLTVDTTAAKREEVAVIIAREARTAVEGSERIARFLGKAAAKLAARTAVSGLILTGGDIAFQACKQLGATALRIIEEVEEGLPLCMTMGEHPIPVITKAGAFGHPESLVLAARHLKKMSISSTDKKERI